MQLIQPEWLGDRPGPLPVTPGLAPHLPLQCRIERVANEFGLGASWDGGSRFWLSATQKFFGLDLAAQLEKAAAHLAAEGYAFDCGRVEMDMSAAARSIRLCLTLRPVVAVLAVAA